MIYELFKSLVIVRDSKIKILKILFIINQHAIEQSFNN